MRIHQNRKRVPYAIVLGLDDYPGLQTARILARRGVPVIAVAKHRHLFFCRTNVCEKILYLDTESDEFIEGLISLGKKLEQKAVLFPCTDLCVLRISRHREVLEPYYHIALPAPEVVEKLMDKLSFLRYALKEKLPIPRTFLLNDRADAAEAAQELRFPCILKPSMKTATWESHTTAKAYKLSNAAELMRLYDRCSSWAEVLIAQDWISGPDSNLYSCNCYFNADSEPLVTFTARKLRQWPPETGSTSLGEECRNDVVRSEAIRLFSQERWHGLGYLEMKKDTRTGEYYIIEPNVGRPTGRSALAEASGVELLYTMYCDKVGWPLPQNIHQTYRGVKWISLIDDLRSAREYWRRGELTIRDWWRSVRGPKTHAVLSLSDPLPFLEDVRRRVMYKVNIYLEDTRGECGV